jgi:hypothetical protein
MHVYKYCFKIQGQLRSIRLVLQDPFVKYAKLNSLGTVGHVSLAVIFSFYGNSPFVPLCSVP